MPGPYPNKFLAFNNMTYSVSLYLQSPDHYRSMVSSGVKDVGDLDLLIQSGGIDDIDDKGNFGAKRNEFFHNDFYIDNVQFKSLVSGTAVNAPHNHFELNFNIIEPMGITFLESLDGAVQDFNRRIGISDNINFTGQTYLMVIRFYGYDEKGKQITASDLERNSDSRAFSEKWIPFMFTNITFRLESDKVIYSCTAVPPGTQIAKDEIHGTVPFNISLQGQTLNDLLDGTEKHIEKGVVNSGLMAALNSHQRRLQKDKKYEIADEYAVEFEEGSSIADAKLIAPGTTLLSRTGMPGASDSTALFKNSVGDARVVKGVRSHSVNAGIKIMKFLDLAIRSSTFISDQYKKINDQNVDNTTKIKKKNNEPLKWFKIRPRVDILGYDKKRRAWAFKTTYVISEYIVKSLETADFDTADCFETHKEYNFWFTGQNTEVLNFSQDFNFLYYTTFGNKHITDPTENSNTQINARTQQAYRVNTREDNQGGKEGLAAEQAANAASVLYSPADQARVEIDIIGDPDWIAQSELFYAASANNNRDSLLPDGSVNYDAAEIYFSVNFNTVVDYNIDTGIADVTQNNVTKDPLANPAGVSQYSFVYRANTITTQLAGGKFTQRLDGTIMFIPEKCIIENTNTDQTREQNERRLKASDLGSIVTKGSSSSTASTSTKTGINHAKLTEDRINTNNVRHLVDGKSLSTTEESEITASEIIRRRR